MINKGLVTPGIAAERLERSARGGGGKIQETQTETTRTLNIILVSSPTADSVLTMYVTGLMAHERQEVH